MIQYDLTDTAMAHDVRACRPPSEAELFALTLGLMLDANTGFAELATAALVLTQGNCSHVAQLLEEHAPRLAREIGARCGLHRRLRELIGIRVTGCSEPPCRRNLNRGQHDVR